MSEPLVPPPTAPSAPADRPMNIPGLIALIVSILAFVMAVVPVLSFLAWLPAVTAIVFAIVGLVVKNRPRAMAGIGLGVAILALIVGIIVSIVTTLGAVATGIDAVVEEQQAEAAEILEVTFEVTGTTPANVSYSYEDANGVDISESTDDVTLPFSLDVQVPRGDFSLNYFSLSATSTVEGEIACTLSINGEVVAQDSSSGSFNLVSCTGFASDAD